MLNAAVALANGYWHSSWSKMRKTFRAHHAREVGWLPLLRIGFALLTSVTVTAPAGAKDRFDPVRSYIRQQLADGSVPSVTVAVVENGRVIWEEGFGWANREKRIRADPDTLYSLASISKPMTATALMTLVEAGKINLDRPANDYLGFAKLTARVGDADRATVRRSLGHTSGLPLHHNFFYADEPRLQPSRDDTILRYGHLMTSPGEVFEYSNLGYGVLDYIIARVSGRTYADYMRTNVFLPLGMTHTSVNIGANLEPYAAERYDHIGKPIPFYGFDHDGGSAVYSSARDMARFALFHMKVRPSDQKAILSEASIDEMHRPVLRPSNGRESYYGLGFFGDRQNGYRVISHGGGMGGVSTRMTMFPDQRSAIIVLTNSRTAVTGQVVDRIAATMFKGWKVAEVSSAETKPSPFVPPAELVGSWRGILSTYEGNVPVDLQVAATGEVHARFGDQMAALVEDPRLNEGVFTGSANSRLVTSDTNLYEHKIQLKLRLQDTRLQGAATAVGYYEPRIRNALSHWLSLQKEAAHPSPQ